jgi:DinB family protein
VREIERIAEMVASGYRDGAWPGVSVRNTFRSLSATEAASHPIAGCHSAWEIALHISFWHDAVRRRLGGDPVDGGDDEDWPAPPEPTPANWSAALDQMDAVHQRLVDTVRTVNPDELDRPAPGKSFTVYFMLHGVPQHDLYHGGQIVLLKKASRSA